MGSSILTLNRLLSKVQFVLELLQRSIPVMYASWGMQLCHHKGTELSLPPLLTRIGRKFSWDNQTNDTHHCHGLMLPTKMTAFSFLEKEANIYSSRYCKDIPVNVVSVQFCLIAEPDLPYPEEGNKEQILLFLNIYATNSAQNGLHICQLVCHNEAPVSTLPSTQPWSTTGDL